jgi:hypothetical protein
VTRTRVAARLGTAGALLLGAAGLVQTTLGAVIPEWTGAKLAPVGLGLLTVGLAALVLVAARRLLRPGLPPGQRAAGALALAGPGLLCLTTVGVLAWVPAVLLMAAGALVVAAWLPARTGVLVLLGTAPLAVAGWSALVPVLVAVVALPLAAAVLRSRPSTELLPNTGKDV